MNIFLTDDGSHSVVSEQFGAMYHSRHGAIQETQCVFIEAGLKHLIQKGYSSISILEIGLGTGLNAFMTYLESKQYPISVHYTALEAYPLSIDEAQLLNYPALLNKETAHNIFSELHTSDWDKTIPLSPNFFFKKQQKDFFDIDEIDAFDLVYFDAFSPEVQPELWTETMFQKIFNALKNNGILTTYCAKGAVKRSLKSVGFTIENLPGPIGKREMTRGMKK